MDNYNNNKLYYDFCGQCVDHRKYAERMLPVEEIYKSILRVGREFPNDAAMLEAFIPVLDMFEDFAPTGKHDINVRNMFICGSVYAALFFIGYSVRADKLNDVLIYTESLTSSLYDTYHPSDARFVNDTPGMINLIEQFKKEVKAAIDDHRFHLPTYSYFAMASAIITNLPNFVPNYEDMQRAGDLIIRRNARLCRTRRKQHDVAEVITQNNQWRIQRIVEDDKHESDNIQ